MPHSSIHSSFYLYNEHKQLQCSDPINAYIYYKNFRIDLLNGKKESFSLEQFQNILDQFTVDQYYENPVVLHLFFELGYFYIANKSLINDHTPLAITIEYSESEVSEIFANPKKRTTIESLSSLSLEEYSKKFEKVKTNLEKGNCYQLNLTHPFYFRFSELEPNDFVSSLWRNSLNIGAYSHYSFIEPLNKLLLSNSPECLFQYNQKTKKLRTMPIKGTEKIKEGESKKETEKRLLQSRKNEVELNIITDLMRNDLTKTSMNYSEVIYKKKLLEVPGLLHQFSVIETEINKKTSVKDIVQSLFPGGSITGAPKKKVMELTHEIENYRRGFYTGSTILLYKNQISASINIRSAEIDFEKEEIKYGSGGGVTMLSEPESEYKEIFNKLESFLRILR